MQMTIKDVEKNYDGFLKTSKGMDSIKNFRERKLRVNKDFNHKQKKDDLYYSQSVKKNDKQIFSDNYSHGTHTVGYDGRTETPAA